MKKSVIAFTIVLLAILLLAGISAKAQTTTSTEARIVSQGLVDFNGRSQNNSIGLSWRTLSTSEDVSFNIQRSKDASEWEDIGKVNSNSIQPNAFYFTDNKPMESVNYYRLRIEHDGRVEYSSLITVKYVTETNKTLLYPNPTKNVIWIKPEEALFQDYLDLEVYDIMGEKVYASKMQGGDLQQLDMSEYQNGYYCIKIGNKTYKVLKQ